MVQEWEAAQKAVMESLAKDQAIWEALSKSSYIEIYTDGSAPVKNPGGPTGSSAVMLGFEREIDQAITERPNPAARIDLGAYVEKRKTEPQTSNNRAEITGLLLAYEALRHLKELGSSARKVTIWSDSQYAIKCATGVWQRKKNTDLWPILDRLAQGVKQHFHPELQWVRGHAGNAYNEAADELATMAAFSFDTNQYAKYRAAQQATGREMPGQQALNNQGLTGTKSDSDQDNDKQPDEALWMGNADYMLVLYTHSVPGESPTYGLHKGDYKLVAKDGRSRIQTVDFFEKQGPDEAEYGTLIQALEQINNRITAAGRNTADYSLLIYSRQELMIKQLRGEYRVKAPALQYAYAQAGALISRFKKVDLLYKDARGIKQLMQT